MRDRTDLEQRRHLPLNAKILMSQNRIREWYNHWSGDVYVSFSGGKLVCSGVNRTGCIFCGFSTHLEKGETKFQKLARTHPKQYEYCMRGGQWVNNPEYDPTAPEYDGEWKNWNPQKIWVPSKDGLGMKRMFDVCNAIYGNDFIRY